MQADCRFCGTKLQHTLVDLGMSPLCESYVSPENANRMEAFYPLHVYVCDNCFLAQLEQFVSAEDIFTEYAYFSSYSDSWLEHAKRYTDMIVSRLALDPRSMVMEVASNDGYLLQYFVQTRDQGHRYRACGQYCSGRGTEGGPDGRQVLWPENRPGTGGAVWAG